MKRAWLCALALGAAGCAGGVTRQEMDSVKKELLAGIDGRTRALQEELARLEQRFARFAQLDAEVRKKIEDLTRLEQNLLANSNRTEGRAERAYKAALHVAEFEEKPLAERLATLRALIAELKKE